MALPFAVQFAQKAMASNHESDAAYQARLTQQLGQTNTVNNEGKVDFNDPAAPMWRKMGFGDQAGYDSVYGSTNSGSPSPASSGVTPSTERPAAPTTPQQKSDDAFNDYLVNNPNAKDAWGYLDSLLQSYGLGNLNSFAKDSIVQGYSSNEVLQRLRETDTYKTRFAAIQQRKESGLPAISEADVVNSEKSYAQVLQQAGLPNGFYDQPEDFTQLIVHDVSPSEFQDRVINGYQAAANADPETKAALQSLYGIDDGHLAAYYLDPTRTEALLNKQLTSAQIAAAAQRTGYGSINAQQAEGLQALGVNGATAAQGFNDLANQHELMQGLPGQEGQSISQQTQFAAEFSKDAAAQQILKRQAEARLSQFAGGGQFAADKTGTTGLGTAR